MFLSKSAQFALILGLNRCTMTGTEIKFPTFCSVATCNFRIQYKILFITYFGSKWVCPILFLRLPTSPLRHWLPVALLWNQLPLWVWNTDSLLFLRLCLKHTLLRGIDDKSLTDILSTDVYFTSTKHSLVTFSVGLSTLTRYFCIN